MYTYNTDIYMHTHKYIHTYTYNKYIFVQYVHIHTIRAYTYNTYVYMQYLHIQIMQTTHAHDTYIYIYTCLYIHIHKNTTLVRNCMYFANTLEKYMQIHTNTCHMHMEEVIRTFWMLQKSVCIWYEFACICTYFCMYLVSICKYCICLQVSMRLALFRALNNCKYPCLSSKVLPAWDGTG